jgi:hypothetical protein
VADREKQKFGPEPFQNVFFWLMIPTEKIYKLLSCDLIRESSGEERWHGERTMKAMLRVCGPQRA